MVPSAASENPPAYDRRLLGTLQQLLELPALHLRDALTDACQRLAEALGCEKVDAFLLADGGHTLEAIGTSTTPMGQLQKELGLDYLPIANGGSVVDTWLDGQSRRIDRVDEYPAELRGIVHDLGVRSVALVPIVVSGERRGVLATADSRVAFFTEPDLRFLEVVAHWLGAVAHRADLVEAMRKAEADRARRVAAEEIVTILAHDFRNHLNPLLGRLHLMRLRLKAGGVIDARDVDTAMRSVQRLARLTSDLLDVGRLDHGLFVLNVAPLDLVSLLQEVGLALSTSSVQVELDASAPLVIIGDIERLRQAFENVIANAVQHSPAGTAVSIRVRERGEGEGDVGVAHVAIVDRGAGIPAEILPKIFDRFASGRGSQGLGLGLYLAAEIAKAHGGSLVVQSTAGRGACFRFELPIGAAPPA